MYYWIRGPHGYEWSSIEAKDINEAFQRAKDELEQHPIVTVKLGVSRDSPPSVKVRPIAAGQMVNGQQQWTVKSVTLQDEYSISLDAGKTWLSCRAKSLRGVKYAAIRWAAENGIEPDQLYVGTGQPVTMVAAVHGNGQCWTLIPTDRPLGPHVQTVTFVTK